MKRLEWTNRYSAMHDSLRGLNIVLLGLSDLEETARIEALVVRSRLEKNDLSEAELVDYLQQASIDYLVHKKERYQNETQ